MVIDTLVLRADLLTSYLLCLLFPTFLQMESGGLFAPRHALGFVHPEQ